MGALEGRDRRGVGHGMRAEEVGLLEDHRQLDRARDEGGREDRRVLPPWLVQVEDPSEASHEGWQEGGLRQGCDGEGEASADDREGPPSGRPEEEHLSWEGPWCWHARSAKAQVTQAPG